MREGGVISPRRNTTHQCPGLRTGGHCPQSLQSDVHLQINWSPISSFQVAQIQSTCERGKDGVYVCQHLLYSQEIQGPVLAGVEWFKLNFSRKSYF